MILTLTENRSNSAVPGPSFFQFFSELLLTILYPYHVVEASEMKKSLNPTFFSAYF